KLAYTVLCAMSPIFDNPYINKRNLMPTKKPLTPRQRELFNALLNDFLGEGFESFTIDNASKRYRCSKSTIYGLGTTRDEILARILVSYFKEISRRTTPEITSSTSFRSEE